MGGTDLNAVGNTLLGTGDVGEGCCARVGRGDLPDAVGGIQFGGIGSHRVCPLVHENLLPLVVVGIEILLGEELAAGEGSSCSLLPC